MILRFRTGVWYLIAFACLTIPLSLYAQPSDPPPMEWGSIPPADLAMTTFPADTNASAIVLCDYGETRMSNNLGLVFTHHKRIKILKPAGYDWGTFSVILYTDDKTERLRGLEGVTYALGPDGKVVTTELDDESVFEEDVDGKHTRYRFTMPALQPGCVIEFRYNIISNWIVWVRDWTFHASIPVLWSEYRVIAPTRVSYAAVTRSFEPLDINTLTEVTQHFTGESASFLGQDLARCRQYRWAMKNLPALRDEPFITTMDDYSARIYVQLAEYAHPAVGVRRVLRTWDSVVDELMESSSYGDWLDPSSDVRKATEQVIAGRTTPEEKATAIYDFIRNTILWSGEQRWAPTQEPEDLLESKKGTSADITFLLVTMLRSAGIQADPLILSTRSNGRIQDQYPIMSQFNYTVALATVGSKQMILDATDPLRPMHLPSVKVLNVKGLLIASGPARWVNITVPYYASTKSTAAITLNAQGEVQGTLETVDEDYSNVAQRRALKEKSEMDVAKSLFDADKVGLTIDSVIVQSKDSVDRPLHIKAWVSSNSYAQVAGENIYINPCIIDRQFTNPFTSEQRKFPVDMAYFRRHVAEVTIKVPDGYVVQEMPKDRTWTLGLGDATFSRAITLEKGVIKLRTTMELQKVEFNPSVYTQLRKFYGNIVTAQAEQVVLKHQAMSPSLGRK